LTRRTANGGGAAAIGVYSPAIEANDLLSYRDKSRYTLQRASKGHIRDGSAMHCHGNMVAQRQYRIWFREVVGIDLAWYPTRSAGRAQAGQDHCRSRPAARAHKSYAPFRMSGSAWDKLPTYMKNLR
jgi:hypothetical protein